MSSNFTVKKVCEQCGQIFLAKTTVTRFCSKTCNSKNYKQQIRNEKIGKSNEVVRTVISHQLHELNSLEFLSVKAAAKLLGASDKIVHNMIRSGRLKATNLSARKQLSAARTSIACFNFLRQLPMIPTTWRIVIIWERRRSFITFQKKRFTKSSNETTLLKSSLASSPM